MGLVVFDVEAEMIEAIRLTKSHLMTRNEWIVAFDTV